MTTIARFFQEGGGYMYWIALTSVFALGIIIERFVFIFFKYSVNSKAFMEQIRKLIAQNNIDRAIKLCNAAPSAALPQVIKAALTRANKGEWEVSNAIETTTLRVAPEVSKRTNSLQALANVATLLGLLGTIMGLIQAFDALAGADPSEKAEMLASGISVAMNTTAFGLIIAIPCMLVHVFLSNQVAKILNEVDEQSTKVTNLLTARYKTMVETGQIR